MKKMFIITAIAIATIFSSNLAFSQTKKGAATDDKVIATVGKEKITYSELEKAFQKNMNRKGVRLNQIPKDSVLDFLNLYINYRLKVNDALSRGYHKDSSVVEDINVNRRVLAESFFYEKQLTEPNINRWVSMREKEYKVAVIITAFGYNGDTTQAYEKITQAEKDLARGADFATIASAYSEDPETAKDGGTVNSYITAGKVNRTFEDAIYSLKEGEYTKQHIRTKFGFFLIKVLDVVPRKYLKLRTMYLEFQSEDDDKPYYMNLADSLVKVIRTGKADFAKIAREHSKDPKTSKDGGLVSSNYTRSTGVDFSGETFMPELENAIYKLKPGEVTDPILIKNAIHVFMLDSILPIDKSNEKDELRALYKRLYFNEDKKMLIDSLSLSYNFSLNYDVLDKMAANLDSTKTTLDSAWAADMPALLMTDVLFTLNYEKTTVKEFVTTIGTKSEFRGTSLSRGGLKNAVEKIIEPKVFDLATANLEERYSDFDELVREFRDGILLFKVEALEVWDKMKFDSVIAQKYYDTTTINLTRPVMYDINEIFLLNDSTAQETYRSIASGDITFEKSAAESTQRFGFRAKSGAMGEIPATPKSLAALAKEKNMKAGDISEPLPFENGYSIIKLNEIEPSRRKTFQEAISDIAPKVQDIVQKQLTKEWLAKVRKNFPVKINQKELTQAMK